jgi:hypothetical protein
MQAFAPNNTVAGKRHEQSLPCYPICSNTCSVPPMRQ